MAIGGRREGAGRKPGSANVRSREIANAAIQEGITPLEYMLKVMRQEEPEDAPPEVLAQIKTQKLDAAKSAAPYVHPRLQALTLKGDETAPIQHNHKVVFETISGNVLRKAD